MNGLGQLQANRKLLYHSLWLLLHMLAIRLTVILIYPYYWRINLMFQIVKLLSARSQRQIDGLSLSQHRAESNLEIKNAPLYFISEMFHKNLIKNWEIQNIGNKNKIYSPHRGFISLFRRNSRIENLKNWEENMKKIMYFFCIPTSESFLTYQVFYAFV